ncbi:MAG: multicopper oxidase family protein, partial [Terriglobales bacterium]
TPGGVQPCAYPNRQEAALLFYHDHAMGISRLNVYAGLFGLYVLRGSEEAALGLPRDEAEIPLVLCDRMLTRSGQLLYPVSGIPGHPWVPEVYGNAVLINGKLLPYLKVEPRAYRFRLLNAANSRFFRLSFSNRLPWRVIGCDQGLLAAPVGLPALALAPAERSDAIVDFSRLRGSEVDLHNDIEPILRVRVGTGNAAPPDRPPARLRELAPPDPASAARTRRLTLDEFVDLGANPSFMLLDSQRWSDPVTERPKLGTSEIWELINLTDDTHPIHLHQVRFRILDRRPFDMEEFLATRKVRYLQPPRPPRPEEAGWKDTVRATGGAVTRILVSFEGYPGRYLWHCHVLEHEANAMMRPYEIEP